MISSQPANSEHVSLPGLGEALPHLAEAGCLYLDYNATTPVWPQASSTALNAHWMRPACEAVLAFLCRWHSRWLHFCTSTLGIPHHYTHTGAGCATQCLAILCP